MGGMPVWLSTMILGLGTVFVGLLALIYIIKLLSYLCGIFGKKAAAVSVPAAAPAGADTIADRPQFIAAVSAVLATIMGTDLTGLRIVSVKKVK